MSDQYGYVMLNKKDEYLKSNTSAKASDLHFIPTKDVNEAFVQHGDKEDIMLLTKQLFISGVLNEEVYDHLGYRLVCEAENVPIRVEYVRTSYTVVDRFHV